MSGITRQQYEFLAQGLNPNRVGKNPQGQSHLQAWDVRRHLVRVFGFGGYDIETKTLDLVREIESPPGAIKYANGGSNNRTVWTVVYRAEVRLVIKDAAGREVAHYEDGAAGDAANQPSLGDAHDMAMKTALSQALKRCAVNLGDQFGLGLYNNGRVDPVVNRSLVIPEGAPVDEHGLARATAQDAPVEPDPEDVYQTLAKQIAGAESATALAAAWEAVKVAYKADQITTAQANELKAAISAAGTDLQGVAA